MARGDPQLRDLTRFDKGTLRKIAEKAEEKADELIRITKSVLAAKGTDRITPDVARAVIEIAKHKTTVSDIMRSDVCIAPSTLSKSAKLVVYSEAWEDLLVGLKDEEWHYPRTHKYVYKTPPHYILLVSSPFYGKSPAYSYEEKLWRPVTLSYFSSDYQNPFKNIFENLVGGESDGQTF